MKKKLSKFCIGKVATVFCVLLNTSTSMADENVSPGVASVVNLRCEYRVDPVGIEVVKPQLSWQMRSDNNGAAQTAYQILVASSLAAVDKGVGDLWDSGKVDSDQSMYVPYDGKSLTSNMECYWKVRIWPALSEGDKDDKSSAWSNPSRWTMGLLKEGDWQAQWISYGVPYNPEGSLVVKKATYRTIDGKVAVDVTETVQKVLAKRKPLKVDPKVLKGDPAHGKVKELVVEYTINGNSGTASAKDFSYLGLFGSPNLIGGSVRPTLLFRKEFTLKAAPDSAFVTVHSPGYFELYLNGTKIGKDVLTPAISDLKKQTFSVTYDVGRHLRPGNNCIGIWLGEGWADDYAVRAQLNATVAGEPVTVGTDTSWKSRKSGLSRIGGRRHKHFGGERLDAGKQVADWSQPELDADSWCSAATVDPPSGVVSSQSCPLNRIGKVIPAVAVTPLGENKYAIDFGVSLTGWIRLKMPALAPGHVVKMSFADRKFSKNRYQTFNQLSEFVSAGTPDETFEHKFNYAGFRYVVVSGLPSAPAKEDATALLVESGLEKTGSFECSNDLLNRIHHVNQWTQRCLNLGGYYVDCPHRERLGYGDGQVASEGFMTNFRADAYYRKWLKDWRGRQKSNGDMPHVAPLRRGGGGPGWGGLLSAITWRHYLYYSDKRVLDENYNAIRRYVDYLESICKQGVMQKFGGKWDFIGDWVPPRRGMDTSRWPSKECAELFNNCYRINQIDLLTKMADVLGKTGDAEKYRKLLVEIRPKVHAAFYDAEKKQYVIDEQSYYVMPLMTGVTPEALRPMMLKKLEKNILEKNSGHLDTGMLGTYFMMEYLREIGRSDLVFTMFNQATYPGWGHMLAEGATTFWEQWNGHASRIHSCFTSPDNWLYQGPAGIQADPVAPGFKNVIIKPAIVGDLTWVKAHHDSPYGRIVSNWKLEGNKLSMDVTIPANSTATLYMPAASVADIMENGKNITKAPGVTFLRMESGRAVLTVASGHFAFVSKYNHDKSNKENQ